MVAIQAPMAVRTVLMVANDNVLTIAHNNLGLTRVAAPTTTDCIHASSVPRPGGTRNADKCFLLS